jgi:hypothetical protein
MEAFAQHVRQIRDVVTSSCAGREGLPHSQPILTLDRFPCENERSARSCQNLRVNHVKKILIATVSLFAFVTVASAADFPRAQPVPAAPAPIGKMPIGKSPVGKSPVGKTPVAARY